MLENLYPIDEDHRHVVAVSLAKRRVFIDVDLFQREVRIAVRSANGGFRFFTKVAAGSGVDRDYCFFHLSVRGDLADCGQTKLWLPTNRLDQLRRLARVAAFVQHIIRFAFGNLEQHVIAYDIANSKCR